MGHSYGGAVALRLAIDQPWRIKSLTLIEPVAFHLLREGSRGDRSLLDSVQQVAATVARGVVTGDYYQSMARFVDFWNGEGAWVRTNRETRRRLSRHAPKVVLDFHVACNERSMIDVYRRRLRFPVAVIPGRCPHDPRTVSAGVPSSEYRILPAAGEAGMALLRRATQATAGPANTTLWGLLRHQ